jgi:glycosyltransferase involved in cell wall biosynthesis
MGDDVNSQDPARAPKGEAESASSKDGLYGWKRFFNAEFYLRRYGDVAEAGVEPAAHFDEFGWKELRDPNNWFSTKAYLEAHPEISEGAFNPLMEFAQRFDDGEPDALQLARAHMRLPSELLAEDHLGETLAMRLPGPVDLDTVRPFFDEDYYVSQMPELKSAGVDPLVHYMTVGWVMGRDPSAEFSTRYYLDHNRDIRRAGVPPLLHYARAHKREPWRAATSVANAQVLDRFQSGLLAEHVAQAVALDPMVALPRENQIVTTAQYHATPEAAAAGILRRRYAGQRFEKAVVIGQVRMSGAARVGGKLATSYAELYGAENVVVIMTDGSDFEHPEWFPDGVEVIDLAALIEEIDSDSSKSNLLLDLLAGLETRHIANVNSRLMWDTLVLYGRQISQEYDVASYLFTWDESPEGVRVGYPIQWINDTIDYLDLILCDTAYLADHLRDRFALEGSHKIATLRTPAEPLEGGDAAVATRTNRVLWAGRFDPQKRVDVLMEIARAHPDLEFHVYGKPVIASEGLEAFDPPPNIVEHGEYSDLGEVVARGFDFYLYTAQWDGIPTILLDMGQRGLPIVAPNVGGVGELVDAETGWLVEQFDDVAGFTDAIAALYADPDLTRGKSAALQERIASDYTEATYLAAVKEALSHG